MTEVRKKRVAYLGNQISPGGGAMSLYLMIKSVSPNQFDKYVFVSQCRNEEMKKDLLRYCKKIEIVDLDEIVSCQTYTLSKYKYLKARLSADKKNKIFLKHLIDNQIDILHINNSVFAHVCRYVKKNSNIKIVSHIREMIDHRGIGPMQRFMIESMLKYSDAIITISDNEAALFKNHPSLQVLPNPFDFSKIEMVKSTFRQEQKYSEDTVLVGMMGRFDKFKGHMDFLKALKIIINKKNVEDKKIKFLIIGINPPKKNWKLFVKKMLLMKDYRRMVENYIAQNKLEEYVQLIPFQYHIFNIIKTVDIFVRPSVSGDPWGRDIIEEMAFSKPIVATGTSQFYVRNGETGYLVHPSSPIELADRIGELINDNKLRHEFGRKGGELIRQMCDIEAYGRKIEYIYKVLE
jgi:glycosyltransferase involved in cell wall biosynthesis